ncbi:MORN repeat-containing protein [Marseillevirus Shanghai 1]|nr:MORN repeat-containing protein [Marseillevirus Shanghai 1]
MRKFLGKRDVVSWCLCEGETNFKREKFLVKKKTGRGYHHELPNGEKHGLEIFRYTGLSIGRSIYKNGKLVKSESFGPTKEWDASYKKTEYRNKDKVTLGWAEGGETNSYVSAKIHVEMRGSVLFFGSLPLNKGSIEHIIAKNFLASFDL